LRCRDTRLIAALPRRCSTWKFTKTEISIRKFQRKVHGLHHESSNLFVTPGGSIALRIYGDEQKEEASWLAACLLLPRDALFYIRRRGLTDEEACAEYGITEATLRFRCRVRGNVQLRRTQRFKQLPQR